MKMIQIGTPYVYEDGKFAYLKAPMTISPDTSAAYIEASRRIKKVHWRISENYPPVQWKAEDNGLWFAVPSEYGSYLCAERSDAFVVAMLWYAMVTGSDISFQVPMSEQMHFRIEHYLIPALCTRQNGYRRIKLMGPVTGEKISNLGAVGTGMSCGIDSFYTLQEYTQPDVPSSYKLTHLTYYNMGAIFHPNRAEKKKYTLEEFYQTTERMSKEKAENARQVARASRLSFVYVKSNLDSDYYRGAYGHTGVYRNCAMTLALQGLFSVYYCSSGGWPSYFDLTLTEGSEHYESLLCHCLSTESLAFVLSDYVTRYEKTARIGDNHLAQKYLDVCFCFNNCGKCSKCRRTLLTLDLLGRVQEFRQIFDVEAFEKDRVQAYADLLRAKDGDALDDNAVFARELYAIAMEKNMIPQESVKLYRRQEARKKIKRILKKVVGR